MRIVNKELLYKRAMKKALIRAPNSTKNGRFQKTYLVSEVFERRSGKIKVLIRDIRTITIRTRIPLLWQRRSRPCTSCKDRRGGSEILARLKKGENLKPLPGVSLDTASAKNGGDVGFFKKVRWCRFERAAATLKGDISIP